MGRKVRLLRSRPEPVASLALIALCALALSAVCGSPSAPPGGPTAAVATPQPVVLATASIASLSSAGYTLTGPDRAASVNSGDAIASVLSQFPGAVVREAVLAVLDDAYRVPKVHQLVWAVSIVPAGGIQWASNGPPGSDPSKLVPPSYDLVFLSADTGAFIEGLIGAN